ncbi:hypothetical protein BC940DRAFT_299792 [Gongronella butleri]|nr:hypothetical protein BC940DRAFT_299792 [Gongronella butleri]
MPSIAITTKTVDGLNKSLFENVSVFLGFYFDHNEKHRTTAEYGPEPKFEHTFTLPVPAGTTVLHLELVNESAEQPQVIAHGQLDLATADGPVISVPLYMTGGSDQLLGKALLIVELAPSDDAHPPAYEAPAGQQHPAEKAEHRQPTAPPAHPPASPTPDRSHVHTDKPHTPTLEHDKAHDWKKMTAGAAAVAGVSAFAMHEYDNRKHEKEYERLRQEFAHKEQDYLRQQKSLQQQLLDAQHQNQQQQLYFQQQQYQQQMYYHQQQQPYYMSPPSAPPQQFGSSAPAPYAPYGGSPAPPQEYGSSSSTPPPGGVVGPFGITSGPWGEGGLFAAGGLFGKGGLLGKGGPIHRPLAPVVAYGYNRRQQKQEKRELKEQIRDLKRQEKEIRRQSHGH